MDKDKLGSTPVGAAGTQHAWRAIYVQTHDPLVLDRVTEVLVEAINKLASEGIEADTDSEWEYETYEGED